MSKDWKFNGVLTIPSMHEDSFTKILWYISHDEKIIKNEHFDTEGNKSKTLYSISGDSVEYKTEKQARAHLVSDDT